MALIGPFFSHRWHGHVGWRLLFWRDLLLVGTLANALCTLAVLVMLSKGAATPSVLAVHLLPLPYGLFMVAALWRAPACPALVRGLGLGWLALTVLI